MPGLDTTDSSEVIKHQAKATVWKNTLVLGFGWLFQFMGLFPIITVQSSLNSNQGLGTVSLSVQTAFGMFTCLFLATGIIRKLGTKWTITLGAATNVCYIAGNFYPTWATLVPTAGLSGIGSSLLWTAHTTYLTKLTKSYAEKTGADVNNATMRFFGVFFALFYCSSVFGNITSSLILGLATDDEGPSNVTLFSYDPLETCGAQYCNQDLGTNFKFSETNGTGLLQMGMNATNRNRSPDKNRVYALCSFCLISVVLSAFILGIFLDSLTKLQIPEKSGEEKSAFSLLVAAVLNLRRPKQLLLLPLTFYNGMDNYFLNTDFTKAFITCPAGIKYIGVITACSGVFSFLSSFIGGWFNTKRMRSVPFILATVTHLIPAVALLYWVPAPNETIAQYVLASTWGVGSGIWSAQLGAYYGFVFADNLEPAIANLVLWNSVAQTLLYGLSHLLCIYIKIYLVLGFLVSGIIGFAAVETWELLQDYKLKNLKANPTPSLATILNHSDISLYKSNQQ